MNPILLYTNNLVDIINIPLEGGGFTKDFYIYEKNTNNCGYFINGFKNIKDFKDSILKLNYCLEHYKYDKDYLKTLNKSLEVYNSIKTNWLDTKFL